jgi:hypothetical protein
MNSILGIVLTPVNSENNSYLRRVKTTPILKELKKL